MKTMLLARPQMNEIDDLCARQHTSSPHSPLGAMVNLLLRVGGPNADVVISSLLGPANPQHGMAKDSFERRSLKRDDPAAASRPNRLSNAELGALHRARVERQARHSGGTRNSPAAGAGRRWPGGPSLQIDHRSAISPPFTVGSPVDPCQDAGANIDDLTWVSEVQVDGEDIDRSNEDLRRAFDQLAREVLGAFHRASMNGRFAGDFNSLLRQACGDLRKLDRNPKIVFAIKALPENVAGRAAPRPDGSSRIEIEVSKDLVQRQDPQVNEVLVAHELIHALLGYRHESHYPEYAYAVPYALFPDHSPNSVVTAAAQVIARTEHKRVNDEPYLQAVQDLCLNVPSMESMKAPDQFLERHFRSIKGKFKDGPVQQHIDAVTGSGKGPVHTLGAFRVGRPSKRVVTHGNVHGFSD